VVALVSLDDIYEVLGMQLYARQVLLVERV